ncbi:LLM class flavin-dependent oxidoreductase [Streptomyces niveus]|uniref:LLM class flavin-dependent oxidoreductase n=1 Tax=Streptomyces niveus TaxID=193462 RepID=UPI00367AFF67
MRAIWAGESIRHDGLHYQVHLASTQPEPHRIPVWMASSTNAPRVISRAAGCDGIFPNPADYGLVPRRSPPSARVCTGPVRRPSGGQTGRSTSRCAATPVPHGRKRSTSTSRDSPRQA